MRKLAIIICLIVVLVIHNVAFAAETTDLDDYEPHPVFSSEAAFAQSPQYSIPASRASASVIGWNNSIARTSSTMATCTSYTKTSALADKISVTYTLYQYNGGWKVY